MEDYRRDFHPGYQTDCGVGQVRPERRWRSPLSHERKEEVAGLLRGTGRARARGDRRPAGVAVVRADAAELGTRGVDRGAAKIRDSCERKQKTDRAGRGVL